MGRKVSIPHGGNKHISKHRGCNTLLQVHFLQDMKDAFLVHVVYTRRGGWIIYENDITAYDYEKWATSVLKNVTIINKQK